MRRPLSILFLLLMLLQAVPVLHFFSSQKEVFYSYVDEEKPEQKTKPEKKEVKEYLPLFASIPLAKENSNPFCPLLENEHPSPILEFLTPPPDAC